MFKDYYAILEINVDATQSEIKKAYKTQALKWHPDKNLGNDTTQQMQDINEAYLILNDTEARERYNIQYKRYQQFTFKQSEQKQTGQEEYPNDTKDFTNSTSASAFASDDDLLNKWMTNAKRQAVELAKQAIEDYKNITIQAATGAAVGCGFSLFGYVVAGLIFTLLLLFVKACNS